jgi:hypothetical protein
MLSKLFKMLFTSTSPISTKADDVPLKQVASESLLNKALSAASEISNQSTTTPGHGTAGFGAAAGFSEQQDDSSGMFNLKRPDDHLFATEGFEWAAGFTNLTGNVREKIKAAIVDQFVNGDTRKAEKIVAALLEENFHWPAGAKYLAGDPLPTIQDIIDDEDCSRKEATEQRNTLKKCAEDGFPLRCGTEKEVADLFVHFAVMKGYALRNHADKMQVVDCRPYWMFDAINDGATYPDCRKIDGAIRRWDSDFWAKHPVPCGRAFCRCSFISLSPEQAKARRKEEK